jgi:hypothetical protein
MAPPVGLIEATLDGGERGVFESLTANGGQLRKLQQDICRVFNQVPWSQIEVGRQSRTVRKPRRC